MKHHNPHTPIMIREALNTQPRVFARYEFGREQVEELSGELCRGRTSRMAGHGIGCGRKARQEQQKQELIVW